MNKSRKNLNNAIMRKNKKKVKEIWFFMDQYDKKKYLLEKKQNPNYPYTTKLLLSEAKLFKDRVYNMYPPGENICKENTKKLRYDLVRFANNIRNYVKNNAYHKLKIGNHTSATLTNNHRRQFQNLKSRASNYAIQKLFKNIGKYYANQLISRPVNTIKPINNYKPNMLKKRRSILI